MSTASGSNRRRQPPGDPRALIVEGFARVVQLLESRVPGFTDHSGRVAGLSAAIAKKLDLAEDMVEDVRIGGLLHDIGMLAIPDEYLTRQGALTQLEYARVRAHPRIGANLVRRFPSLHHPAVCIAFHHERWDGSGYPKGLVGEGIPLGARIVGIAEVYAALVEPRGHRDPMPPGEAIDTLSAGEGAWFDRDTFLALVDALENRASVAAGVSGYSEGAQGVDVPTRR